MIHRTLWRSECCVATVLRRSTVKMGQLRSHNKHAGRTTVTPPGTVRKHDSCPPRFHAEWSDELRLGASIGTWQDETAMIAGLKRKLALFISAPDRRKARVR